jgi:hypothetical protein
MQYDVVIIGSGLAGSTLACHLPSHFKIAIIEKGDFEYSKRINTNDYGNLSNESFGNFPANNYSLNFTNIKQLGGNNKFWSGWSIPMQENELKNWPINIDEMKKYYKFAEEYFKFLPFKDFENLKEYSNFGNKDWNIKFWQFGNKKIDIKKKLKSKKNIEIFTKSEFKEIILMEDRVKKISFINNDQIKEISCKSMVIAQGGLESTKTLLRTKSYLGKQLGNENGHLGKYYMEHPHITLGHFFDNNNLIKNLFVKKNNYKAGFFLKNNYINNIINGLITIDNHDLHSRPDVYKLLFIARLLRVPRNLFKKRPFTSIVSDLSKAAMQLVFSKIKKKKFIVGIFEQEPNINSKIKLSDNDKIILDWQISDNDIKSIINITNNFKDYIKTNISHDVYIDNKIYNTKNWFENYKDKVLGIGHHMGTTMMSSDKKKGVVDKDLKLHHINNLYICSSSVFPTGGVAHPTFTVCALAIRLAHHLEKNINLNH